MNWKSFAKRIFDLQNKIRQNPKSFIPYLERSLKRFNGNIYTTEDGCSAIRTEEGQVAFIEAIEFLRVQKPVLPLKWNDDLERAAKDHCNDLGATGQMSSIGSGKLFKSLFLQSLCLSASLNSSVLIKSNLFSVLCFRWLTPNRQNGSLLHH